MLCNDLQLALQFLFPSSKAVHDHAVLKLAKCALGRISRIEAGELSADVLAVLADPSKHDVSRVEIRLVAFGDSIKLKSAKHTIKWRIDVYNKIIAGLVLDDANNELIDFWDVSSYFLDDVDALVTVVVLLQQVTEVQRF